MYVPWANKNMTLVSLLHSDNSLILIQMIRSLTLYHFIIHGGVDTVDKMYQVISSHWPMVIYYVEYCWNQLSIPLPW